MSKVKQSLKNGLIFSIPSYLLYKSFLISIIVFAVMFGIRFFNRRFYERIERKKVMTEFYDFLTCLTAQFNYSGNFFNSFKNATFDYNKIYGENRMSRTLKQAINMASVSKENHNYLHYVKNSFEAEEVSDFINSTIICMSMGNSMAENIMNSTTLIKEKIELEQTIEVMITEKKSEQGIVSMMPFLIIAIFLLTANEYISMMYVSFTGRLVMSVAGILFLIQRTVSRRIMDIEV